MKVALVGSVASVLFFACAADGPALTPEERCLAADEHVRTCVESYCATAAADDPLCIGGSSIPAASGSCADRDASSADRFADADCGAIVTELAESGGKADGFCPRWLCWLCDCEEEATNCCVQCNNDLEPATCTTCFETYGKDTDDDGTNDAVWVVYCTGAAYCDGCVDRNCDGVCDG